MITYNLNLPLTLGFFLSLGFGVGFRIIPLNVKPEIKSVFFFTAF